MFVTVHIMALQQRHSKSYCHMRINQKATEHWSCVCFSKHW